MSDEGNNPQKWVTFKNAQIEQEEKNFITRKDGQDSLFTAAFGDIDTPHVAIDKKALYKRIVNPRDARGY